MRSLKQIPQVAKIGFLIWSALAICRQEYSFLEWSHVEILFLAAPLFLVPSLLENTSIRSWMGLISAILLTISYQLPQGFWAAILATGWLGFTMYLAFEQIKFFRKGVHLETTQGAFLAAYLYLPIGAAWAVANRLGFQPLGFKPIIVLLTAVHFHYAGFIVPFLYALAAKVFPNRIPRWLVYTAIFGVPSVAVGITTSQFGWPQWLETSSVFPMVISGFGLGYIHIFLAFKEQTNPFIRVCWVVGGLALCSGMSLAFLYGIRVWFPISFLSIPWMYAVHGTLNAVGFALPAVIAWSLYSPLKAGLRFPKNALTPSS